MIDRFETPVLFLIFNRPTTTQAVFEKIREIKPAFLYVAADGPRPDRIDEAAKCLQTREILRQVDWPCEVNTLFRETNFGCRHAVSSAIDWFFENVEAGIIIEDDVLPDISFFYFCADLLKKYKDDLTVFQINGTNFLTKRPELTASYFFSKYPFIWGWATWKRAWAHYDLEMSDYPKYEHENILKNVLSTRKERRYHLGSFKRIYYRKYNSWDPQWEYAVLKNNGLSITPMYNLSVNIGTNNQSTHVFLKDSVRDHRRLESVDFPLRHPMKNDDYTLDTQIFQNYRGRSLSRILRIIKENGLINVLRYYKDIHFKPSIEEKKIK